MQVIKSSHCSRNMGNGNGELGNGNWAMGKTKVIQTCIKQRLQQTCIMRRLQVIKFSYFSSNMGIGKWEWGIGTRGPTRGAASGGPLIDY